MKKPGHSDRRNGVYMQQDTHKYIQDKKTDKHIKLIPYNWNYFIKEKHMFS